MIGKLLVFIALSGLLCSASIVCGKEPTNRPQKIFKDVRAKKMPVEAGLAECRALMKDSKNVPLRVEAAETFAKICYIASQLGYPDRNERNYLPDWQLAVKTCLPVLEQLKKKHPNHLQSLPALCLQLELSKMIREVADSEKDPKRAAKLRPLSLAYLEAILDAPVDGLVPPDKILAADEDLELEKKWAAKELKKLKERAASSIAYHCSEPRDFSYVGQLRTLDRIKKKYPNNPVIQKNVEAREKEISRRRARR